MSKVAFRILALCLPLLLAAEAGIGAPRQVNIPAVADARLPFITAVVAPQANSAALSDGLSLLVIGHKASKESRGKVSIFSLDARGVPSAEPTYTLALPQVPALGEHKNFPISLLFHPRLPLLYVWQETLGPPLGSARNNVVLREFDHLLVYKLSPGQPPQLRLATGRGMEFAYSHGRGSIALDPAAGKMYLPNLRALESPDTTSTPAIGYLKLDAQGLPRREGEKLDLTVEAVPQTGYPTGMGFAPGAGDAVVVGQAPGPMTWDPANRRARFCTFYLTPSLPGAYRLTAHPQKPVIYLSAIGYSYAFRMEHADGYLSLLPQVLNLAGAVMQSPPIVLTRQNKIAIGGVQGVYVINLDERGALTDSAVKAPVANPAVEVMAYSEKFDRLYVMTEKPAP